MKVNYQIIEQNDNKIVLQDLGPWNKFQTITNAAEIVCAEMSSILNNRRLFYFDSEGELTELLVDSSGKFVGFG